MPPPIRGGSAQQQGPAGGLDGPRSLKCRGVEGGSLGSAVEAMSAPTLPEAVAWRLSTPHASARPAPGDSAHGQPSGCSLGAQRTRALDQWKGGLSLLTVSRVSRFPALRMDPTDL